MENYQEQNALLPNPALVKLEKKIGYNFKKLEHKQVTQDDKITNTLRKMEAFVKEAQELKIAQTKDIKELEVTKEDIEALKACYKFGPRLKVLENQAKSDLLAVTR